MAPQTVKKPRESARGAHEGRRHVVSPMSKGVLQAVRRSKTTIANCGTKLFRALIVPGGVYGGDGAIFAEENPIFQSKIASLQFPRPEIRRILAETGRGGSGGGVYSPATRGCEKTKSFFTASFLCPCAEGHSPNEWFGQICRKGWAVP